MIVPEVTAEIIEKHALCCSSTNVFMEAEIERFVKEQPMLNMWMEQVMEARGKHTEAGDILVAAVNVWMLIRKQMEVK